MWSIKLACCFAVLFLFAGTLVAQENSDVRAWSRDPRSTLIRPEEGSATHVPGPVVTNPVASAKPRVIETPAEILVINPNVRVHPSTTVWQSEVPITRHPTNGNILYGSSNAVRFSPTFISEGMYLTTNGGTTWFGSDTTNAPTLSSHSGDPAPAITPNGDLYISYLYGASTVGMGVAKSTNMGQTWTNTTVLTSLSSDKNHTFVDDAVGSAYYGRVYVTWSDFSASLPNTVVSYTSNNGSSWTAPITVHTATGSNYDQGVNGAVGPGGVAYIVWQNPMAGSPYTGQFIGFAKSTNGGATWTATPNIYACNGIRGTLTAKASIRVNDFPSMAVDKTGGPRNGWIYIVTAEKNLSPAGSDPDIIFHRSTDGGTTWSAGIRVNQDALNNGKIQYMPWMCVDEGGGLNVVYYDDRTTTSDSATVFVSRSLDGGNTWTDMEVSDHHFKPAPISGLASGYQGDYIGITYGIGKVYPYWADNSTGIYQAWVGTVTTTENFGWVKGTVTNVSGGAALAGVTVDFTDAILQSPASTDGLGFYKAGAKVDTPATTRNVTLRGRKFGFRDTLIALTITRNDTFTRNFAMTPVANGTLAIRTVKRDSGNIASFVTIKFAGTTVDTGTTSASTGMLTKTLPAGSYDVIVDPPSPYGTRTFTGVVVNGSSTTPLYVVVRAVLENAPAAMRDTLGVGQVHSKTLALTNTTTDSVAFRITDDNALRISKMRIVVPEPAIQIPAVERPKGAPDITHGDSPQGHGGPDAFGYSWIDSDDPGGPTFNWFNIKGVGTQISTWTGTSDDGYATVALPFTFTFYGNNYTSASVVTNGFLQFNGTSTAYSNDAIPSTALPNNAIYPFWDDLNFGEAGGTMWYYNDVANSRFIFQWDSVSHYLPSSTPGRYSFQAILKPNGEVLFQYKSMTGTLNSATIGVENAAGTVALQVVYNAAYIHDNLAVRIYLPDAPWLSESPLSGKIPPLSTQNIQVTFDATGLTQGTTYNANIFVDATHPDVASPFAIPASLKVNPASGPLMILARTSVTFPATEVGSTSRDSVTVRNGGNATLNLTSVTSSSGKFSVSASSTAIAAGDSARIRIVYNPVPPAGTDTGRVIVLSNDPLLPRADIMLNGTSIRVAHFTATPDSFYFSRPQGTDTTTSLLKIKSTGTDTLRYSINESLLRMVDVPAPPREIFTPLTLQKGERDPRPGWSSPLGQGGPDAFGYRWIDSDEPGGPAFSWVDISSTGAVLDSASAWVPTGTFRGGDEGYFPVTLPFTFSFYGVPKDTIFIGSNGNVMFQRPTGNLFTNAAFPTAGDAVDNHIGVWWDDLEVRAGAKVYYGLSGGSFVVQFQGMALYNATVQNYTFEVILMPGGTIKMQYLNMGFNGGTLTSSSIGIENSNASIGLGTVFNAAYMHNNLAIIYSNDILPWLSLNRTSGTIAPGDSQNVQLRVVPNQPSGTYVGHLQITGNTADTKSVGVRLDVTSGGNSVTVTSPNGSEVWTRGNTYPITWSKTGSVDSVMIEFSTAGLGGPWSLISPGYPARATRTGGAYPKGHGLDNPEGTYNWTIPNGTTPSSNCYVRVSWKSNTSVNDASDAAFTIQAAGGGDTTVTVNLNSGWNLSSNPVTRAPNTDSVKLLYPNSINNYAYAFVGGYQQRFVMPNGPSFWLKFPSASVGSVTGGLRVRDTISVATGWNLIGTISCVVDTSSVVSLPPGLRVSNWFGYGTGYSPSTQLVPGKGYWVKASTTGKFVLANPAMSAASSSGPGVDRSIESLHTLTITAGDGGSQVLYFGADALHAIPVMLYSMPPLPPAGAFDARFQTPEGGSMVQTYDPATPQPVELSVNIQSDAYPLVISWKVDDESYTLIDGSGRTHFNPIEISGSGSMSVSSNEVTRLIIRAISKEAVPTEYALAQNFPNPFNPTTRIKYQLPTAGRVTLKVFDVLGKEVVTLVDEIEEAGYKSVVFDAARISTGVYFYRLQVGNYVETRKLMILK